MGTRPNALLRKWGKKIESARTVADDRRLDLNHAVALLEMLGDHCQDHEELGSRIEYMARVIAWHTEELRKEHEKIELAAMAMRRGDDAGPNPASAGDDGNVVHLNPPDGDAA